jgi:Barstar (barnase inhibitor)
VTIGDEVIWTITNVDAGDERASVDVVLDALHAFPDHAGSNLDGLFDRLADRGVHVIAANGDRFELRDSAAD